MLTTFVDSGFRVGRAFDGAELGNPLVEPSDDALAALVAGGDETALRMLLDRYDRLVRYTIYRTARGMCKRDPQFLDSVATEAWMGFVRAVRSDSTNVQIRRRWVTVRRQGCGRQGLDDGSFDERNTTMRNTRCIRATTAVIVAAAVSTLSVGTATAFVLNGNRWPGSHPRVPFYVSTNLQGNIPYDGSATFDEVVNQIQGAAEVWNTQGASDFQFSYAGTTSVSQVSDDGINAVIFSSGKCPSVAGCSAVAYYHQTNGVFRGFDIVLYKYRGGSDTIRVLWKTQMTFPSQMDLWTVVLHEFGHAVGLDHSNFGGVVMGCGGAGVHRRTLYSDDIAGIQALYGAYTNEGLWASAEEVDPGGILTLFLSYPRAAGRDYRLYVSTLGQGPTRSPVPDSRMMPLTAPWASAESYAGIFQPANLCSGSGHHHDPPASYCLDGGGGDTVIVQLPANALDIFGPDLYLAVVTLNSSVPSGYEDVSVGAHVQIVAPPPCTTDADCDDGDPCTDDVCDAGSCTHPPYDCDDGNACTVDSCVNGWCVNTPVACDDHNACTTDTCDPSLGCISTPISCDDGNACTQDSCDPATGCAHTPLSCNDGNACTTDTCDGVLGCIFTPIAGCTMCKASGQTCSRNADCCSGLCKGKGLCN
jgi:hypothetical protein